MRVLDLFSGVGMFARGMESAGFEIAAFCEIEPWPRKILAKHWPDVPRYHDVKELNREQLEKDGVIPNTQGQSYPDGRRSRIQKETPQSERSGGDNGTGSGGDGRLDRSIGPIDVITGGFPCQDLSVAGKQAGIEGSRSGLFYEIIRLIGELRPRYVVLENVAALLTGNSGEWMRTVLREFAEIGFDVEWHDIPAGNTNGLSAGAPHRRERVWIIAYPNGDNAQAGDTLEGRKREGKTAACGCGNDDADANGNGCDASNEGKGGRERSARRPTLPPGEQRRPDVRGSDCDTGRAPRSRANQPSGTGRKSLADAAGRGLPGPMHNRTNKGEKTGIKPRPRSTTISTRATQSSMGLLAHGVASRLSRSRWLPEPGISRVAVGVPDRVNKLKALGNGLIWQIPAAIGAAIMEREA